MEKHLRPFWVRFAFGPRLLSLLGAVPALHRPVEPGRLTPKQNPLQDHLLCLTPPNERSLAPTGTKSDV